MWIGHQSDTRYFNCVSIAGSAINPRGQASDPDYDIDIGGLLFDPNRTEVVSIIAEIPGSWAQDTILTPRVHWQKTTSAAGSVVWQLQYRWAPIGQVMDSDWTVLTASTVSPGTPDNNTEGEHLVTNFPGINAVGKSLGDVMITQFARIGGDAADDYGADARLIRFNVQYESDSPGSLEQYGI